MIIALALVLAPFMPLLGVQALAYHAAALIAVAATWVDRSRVVAMRPPEMALLVFTIVYGASLTYAVSFGAPRSRVIGSSYNLSFWVMGLLVLWALGDGLTERRRAQILRAIHFVFMAACVVGLIALGAWFAGVKELSFTAPLSLGAGIDSDLLKTSRTVGLVQRDWLFGGPWPRTAGFANYATAYGALLVISGIGARTARRMGVVRRRPIHLVAIPGSIAGLILSGSRGTLLGLGAALTFALITGSRRKGRAGVAVVVGVCLLLVAVSFIVRDLSTGRVATERFRPGSTQTRLELYERSLDVWRLSPMIGIGMKPKDQGDFPVGSHSTYVGILVRTGALGATAFLAFWVAMGRELLRRARRARDRAAAELAGMGIAVVTFVGVWMLGDDLDAPQLVAFLVFVSLGLARSGTRASPTDARGSQQMFTPVSAGPAPGLKVGAR